MDNELVEIEEFTALRQESSPLAGHGPTLPVLKSLCKEVGRYLMRFDEQPWSEWFSEVAEVIARNPRVGVRDLLDHYKGLGGICDVELSNAAGHNITPQLEAVANEQLMLMLSKVNELAINFSNQTDNALKVS